MCTVTRCRDCRSVPQHTRAVRQVPEPRVRIGTPLTGLLTTSMPHAPSKWQKYDMLYDALKTSADSQPVWC